MLLRSLDEGIGIALDALRANKVRSALTMLGVIIGVAVVMTMASLVEGVRSQIFAALESAGPSVFYLKRIWPPKPPGALPAGLRARPLVSEEEAAAIAAQPGIRHAGLWLQTGQRLEADGVRTQIVGVWGADDQYMEILGGTLLRGRFFTRAEERGSQVAVLEADAALRLFGEIDPIGRPVRIGGQPFRVIGLYGKPNNIFEPPGRELGAIVPFRAARRHFRIDESNELVILVKAAEGMRVDVAQDVAVRTMRRLRKLRPAEPEDFALITQDQVTDIIGKLTGAFFLVMTSLSSVALLVGGIGVMAIMMVSVTARTSEIGLRKALGATRREILLQFLVEAATLTFIGGLLGVLAGLGAGEVLKRVLGFTADVPVWSAVVACAVSIGIGLVFGLVPANRASKLDPVEALRHE
jgi:putative ABC transport system permease protein